MLILNGITLTTPVAILIGLILYAILMFGASIYWMRRVKKATDFLVGGRSIPPWILAGNIASGSIGTGVIIGASGLAYNHGWAGCAYPIGLGIGTVLAGLMFAVMRRHKFMTLIEEVASYYERNRIVTEFSNITLFLAQLCWLTVQIMGGAAVLAAVTGFSQGQCVVAAGILTAAISLPGGFKSVAYTDFLQAMILLSGFAIVTYSALQNSGGLVGLRQTVPPSYFTFLGVGSYGGWNVLGLISALVLSVIADPNRRLSMYSAKTERGARVSMITAGSTVFVFSIVVAITGMYAFHLNPNLPLPDEALLWLVMHVLPSWLAAFVVVSIAAGIFSCATGDAMSIGSLFVRHIFPLVTRRLPGRPLLTARVALIFSFILSTVVAMHAGSIVSFVVEFLPITMSGLAIIILFGRFWPRSTWQGALVALIVTPAVSLAGMFLFPHSLWNNAVILAVPGAIGLVLVSLITPRPTKSFNEVAEAFSQERERGAVEGEALVSRL